MIKLFTDEEYKKCRSTGFLQLKCEACGKTFKRLKKEIKRGIEGDKNLSCRYCSNKCTWKDKRTIVEVVCLNCGKKFNKRQAQIQRTKRNFCNHSCSATYNNTHKINGTRCSKLEKWLMLRLTDTYPSLAFDFNKKDAINSELDVYIPSLRLAFELNGIFHYEPIYGADKLKQIQNNDNRKFQACIERGIELCIIDCSKHKYFKESTCIPYWEIIKKNN